MTTPPPESDRERRSALPDPPADAAVRRELEHHRDLLVERLRAEGWTEEAASREAARRLDVEAWVRRLGPDARRGHGRRTMRRWLESIGQESRSGWREIRRRPGYAAAVTLALAVGIGGSGLVLSLAHSIFLRPVPVPEPERVVRVWEAASEAAPRFRMAYPTLRDYRAGAEGTADLAGFIGFEVAIQSDGRAFEVDATAVTWNYFRALGLTPARGRFFRPEEEPEVPPPTEGESAFEGFGAPPVAVVSWDLWTRRFGADPDIVGRTVRLGGHPVTVVGVAPHGFRGLSLTRDVQVWTPIPLLPDITVGLYANRDALTTRHVSILDGVARLSAGVRAADLVERLGALRTRLVDRLGTGEEGMPEPPARVALHATEAVGAVALGADHARLRGFVAVVSVLSIFVLVVGTLNAMQLRMVRMRARSGELGVRYALGANRGRIVAHVMADAAYLGAAGVVIGVLLAKGALAALSRFTLPGGVALERLPLTLDAGFFVLLGGVTVVAVTAAAATPAVLALRRDPATEIRRGRRRAGRGALVAGQVAMCTVLVVSAALFLRSFVAGMSSDLGFETEGRVALTFSPAAHAQADADAVATRVREAALATPGVEAAVVAAHLPPEAWTTDYDLIPIDGTLAESARSVRLNPGLGATPTMFGIRLVEGRDLDPSRPEDRDAAVINRAAAEALFPELDPLGRSFKLFRFEDTPVRIVGIVENATLDGVEASEEPWAWLDARRYQGIAFAGRAHLVVRGAGDGRDLLAALQPRLADAVPEVLFLDPRTVETEVVRALMPQHLGLLLFGVFGGIAVLLASIGVAGVIGFELASRRRELAIRTALGARWAQIVRSVAGSTWTAAGVGLVVGLFLVGVVGRVIGAFLLGTGLFDPLALLGALAVLALAVAAASGVALLRTRGMAPAAVLAAEGRRSG